MDLVLLFRTFEAPNSVQTEAAKEKRFRTMAALQKNPSIVSVQPTDPLSTLYQWIPPVAQFKSFKFLGQEVSSSTMVSSLQIQGEANPVLEVLVYVA